LKRLPDGYERPFAHIINGRVESIGIDKDEINFRK